MKNLNEKERLFGTNGVRGVVNEELTPEVFLNLAHSVGSFFQGGKFLLAYDGRLSSPMLADAAASGLVGVGCEVHDVGMMPTPALQFLTKTWQMDGGIMITASHNPPEYNGMKVIDRDGIEIPREKEAKIEKIFFEKKHRLTEWHDVGKRVSKSTGIEEYKDSIKKHIDQERVKKAGLKLVVDPANGVGGLVTPYLLNELGCKVLTINSNIDGNFPGRLPEPTLKNIERLCEVVKASDADLGIALDGDADRAIFVDETGQGHWGDRSFALVIRHYLLKNPGESIVTPVSSSKMIEETAEQYGGKVKWTKVGSIGVSREMQKLKANLGGEENGGIFYGPHQPVRDGCMSTALVIDMIAQEATKFSKLVSDLPSYSIIKDKIPCPEALKVKVLEVLREREGGEKIDLLDGIKIWFSDGSWVLIRPSGTEPIYRIFAEADNEKNANELVRKYKIILNKIIDEVK